jgi:hypothetical protein
MALLCAKAGDATTRRMPRAPESRNLGQRNIQGPLQARPAKLPARKSPDRQVGAYPDGIPVGRQHRACPQTQPAPPYPVPTDQPREFPSAIDCGEKVLTARLAPLRKPPRSRLLFAVDMMAIDGCGEVGDACWRLFCGKLSAAACQRGK